MIRPRFGLAAKVSLLALANFLLLGGVFAVYVRLQLRGDMKSFLMTAARERILAISRQITLDLQETSTTGRNRLLARYSAEQGVRFFLFQNNGTQVAGENIQLPDAVTARLAERPPRADAPPPEAMPEGPPPDQVGPPPPVGPDGPANWTPPPRDRKRADPKRRAPPPRLGGGDPFLVETAAAPHYWVGVRIPIRSEPGQEPLHGTLLIASSNLWTNPFFFQLTPWLVMGGVASLISVLCWVPLVRGVTGSIQKMLEATSTIAQGRFAVDAATNRNDELGELGESINRMAAQLDALVRGQKRFLADAAHELRSPLGRMQLAAGILERKTDATDVGYLADLKEDVEMMSALTDELLTYARAESMPAAIRLAELRLQPLIEKAIRMEKRDDVEIRVDVEPGLRGWGEENLVCRAIANVVRNSVRYAGREGPITIVAKGVNGAAEIRVEDSGPGMPEEALTRIFTPFYRLDESRNRKTGGAGLGLAIVKSCMEACGGSASCRNRQGQGLEVTLRLKLAG